MMLAQRTQKIQPPGTSRMRTIANEMKAKGVQVINFAAGELDVDTFELVKEGARDAIDTGKNTYTPTLGLPALRRQMSEVISRHTGVDYAPDEVGLTAGDCDLFNAQYAVAGKGRCIHSIGRGVQERKRAVTSDQSQDFFAGLAKQYFALTLFRIAPYSLKDAIYDDGQWMSMSYAWKKRMDKYLNNFFSLRAMPTVTALDSDRPTFNFITNETPRAPFLLDAQCLPANAQSSEAVRSSPRFADPETQKIFETHRCVLRGVGEFMAWMSEQGVLDNTHVVLASDHGWVSDNPLLDGLSGQRRYSMYQAFLMVKDFDADSEMREDPTYIANFSVPGLLCETIGGCVDNATGKTIRYEPLRPPVALYETPWQPAGQTLNDYVIDAIHENSGPVGQQLSWRTMRGAEFADTEPHHHLPTADVPVVTAGLPR